MSISKNTFEQINKKLEEIELVERKSISSLTVGKIYIIKNMVSMTTRFGKTILATLHDKTSNLTFQSFLPKRVVQTFTDDLVQLINKFDDKYYLCYLGQSSVLAGGNTRALLNFGVLE